jgi:hypothetical protein
MLSRMARAIGVLLLTIVGGIVGWLFSDRYGPIDPMLLPLSPRVIEQAPVGQLWLLGF